MNCSGPDWFSANECHQQILTQMNEAMAAELLPALLYVGMLMPVGLLGNSLVCYVYSFRLRMGTQSFLIVCLAVFDLMSCVFLMPTEIADMRLPYMFDNDTACRLLRFVGYFSVSASTLTLLVIALDRFRKICRPLPRRMSQGSVKMEMAVVVVLATVSAVPTAFLFGATPVSTSAPGVTGSQCYVSEAVKRTMFPLLYNAFLLVGFCVILLILSLVYFRIWLELWRHKRYMAERASNWDQTTINVIDMENLSADITRQTDSHAQTTQTFLGDATDDTVHAHNDTTKYNSDVTDYTVHAHNTTTTYNSDVTDYTVHAHNDTTEYNSDVIDDAVHAHNDTTEYNSDVTDDAVHAHNDTSNYTSDVTGDAVHAHTDTTNYTSDVTGDAVHAHTDTTKQSSDVTENIVYVHNDTTKHNTDVTDDLVHAHADTTKHTSDVTDDAVHALTDTTKHSSNVTDDVLHIYMHIDTTEDISDVINHAVHEYNDTTKHSSDASDDAVHVHMHNDTIEDISDVTDDAVHVQMHNDTAQRISDVTNDAVHVHVFENTTEDISDVTDDAVHVHNDTSKNNSDVTDGKVHYANDVMKCKSDVTACRPPTISSRLQPKPSKPTTVRAVRTRKATSIAYTITAVFFISFLPHLVLSVCTILVPDFMPNLEGASRAFYSIFIRSYLINSVSNAFIYGVLNKRFRVECRALLCQLSNCTPAQRPVVDMYSGTD